MLKVTIFFILVNLSICLGDHEGYGIYNGYGGHDGHNEDEDHANQGYYGQYAKHYSYPKYSFEYGVNDPHTGDHKSQWEQRDGDLVKGAYTIHEPDGTVRVVEYVADKLNGFNAVVKRFGHAYHPTTHYAQHDGDDDDDDSDVDDDDDDKEHSNYVPSQKRIDVGESYSSYYTH